LLLISVIVFALMQFIPGGPLAVYENDLGTTAADMQRLREQFGLDSPTPVQYLHWLDAAMHGDWGNSFVTGRPTLVEIGERLPNTLLLSGTAFLIALLIAIPLGILSAFHQYSWFDHLMTLLAFAGHSIPVFWLGLILLLIFNILLKNPLTGGPLLPGGGMFTIGAPFSLEDRATHLALPVSALVIFNLATYIRYVRAGLLDVLHQDYIRTAYAKGQAAWPVLLKHALRNAILPLVTVIGLELPSLAGGALVTETIFAWPGMGRLFFNSIERADYAVIMGIMMLTSTLVVGFGLLTDIAYAWLDPRIRFES
jgi:peptide/nickel transport system permease protein